MSEPFIAEIRIFASNFAPRGWAYCDGQLLPVAQNTALFSLIGTTYGGDGRTTMGLPNLQGRSPMHPGRGPGLTSRRLGQQLGTEYVTLSETQMPNHNHSVRVDGSSPGDHPPSSLTSLANARMGSVYRDDISSNLGPMNTRSISNTGGTQSHPNNQPTLAIGFIIALVGLYPSRG